MRLVKKTACTLLVVGIFPLTKLAGAPTHLREEDQAKLCSRKGQNPLKCIGFRLQVTLTRLFLKKPSRMFPKHLKLQFTSSETPLMEDSEPENCVVVYVI